MKGQTLIWSGQRKLVFFNSPIREVCCYQLSNLSLLTRSKPVMKSCNLIDDGNISLSRIISGTACNIFLSILFLNPLPARTVIDSPVNVLITDTGPHPRHVDDLPVLPDDPVDPPYPIEFMGVPADVALPCGWDLPPWPEVTAANDRRFYPVSHTQQIAFTPCGGKTVTRTWSVKDESGRTISRIQTISFADEVPPVLKLPADTLTVMENAIPQPVYEAGDRGCSTFTVEVREEKVKGNDASQYVLIRQYVATDACGNSTVKKQTVIVHSGGSDDARASSASVFDE